jgi:hypothetical protein
MRNGSDSELETSFATLDKRNRRPKVIAVADNGFLSASQDDFAARLMRLEDKNGQAWLKLNAHVRASQGNNTIEPIGSHIARTTTNQKAVRK